MIQMKSKPAIIFSVITLCLSAVIVFGYKDYKTAIPEPDKDGHITIMIQPFDDLSKAEAEYVYREVKKVYQYTTLLKSIKLPPQAYYKPRNRYRADSIIAWLSRRTEENYVTIGLTSKDISTDKGKIKDWGVMGLGYQPGNACAASTFRLNKKNILDQLFKVSIHELGHTQGLPHCADKTCYMANAEGGNPTDGETGFCRKCKRLLRGKGWLLPD